MADESNVIVIERCRVCSSEEENDMTSIYSTAPGKPWLIIVDMISSICPIKLDVNDTFSKQICSKCLSIINSAYNLRVKSVQVDIDAKRSLPAARPRKSLPSQQPQSLKRSRKTSMDQSDFTIEEQREEKRALTDCEFQVNASVSDKSDRTILVDAGEFVCHICSEYWHYLKW